MRWLVDRGTDSNDSVELRNSSAGGLFIVVNLRQSWLHPLLDLREVSTCEIRDIPVSHRGTALNNFREWIVLWRLDILLLLLLLPHLEVILCSFDVHISGPFKLFRDELFLDLFRLATNPSLLLLLISTLVED